MRIQKIQKEKELPYAPRLSNTTRRIASKKSFSMQGSLSRDHSKSKWENLHEGSQKKALDRKDADMDLREFEENRGKYTF